MKMKHLIKSDKISEEVAIDTLSPSTDMKHNDVDIGYAEFYEDLNPPNTLTGGVGDTTGKSEVDPIELSMGQTVEMEHTTDPSIAAEIALDHLSEDPHYYTKLRKSGLASELDMLNSSSGFGDPDHPINDKKRLGSDVTCTPGNNVVGKIGNTPNGDVEGVAGYSPIVDKSTQATNANDYTVDIEIEEPAVEANSIRLSEYAKLLVK